MIPTNPRAFSLERRTLCFASSLTGKMATGLVAICIMLNCLVPRFCLSSKSYDIFAQALSSQSVLLQFFSLSTLPLKLVNSLLENDSALPCPVKDKLPEGNDNGRCADSSVDFSAFNYSKKLDATRCGGGPQSDTVDRLSVKTILFQGDTVMTGQPVAVHTFGCPLMVRFIFLLPRSTIGDDVTTAVRGLVSNTSQL